MKKTAVLALLIVLMISLVSCGEESDIPDGMKEASGDAAVFDMFVPESWIVDLQTGAVSAHVSETDRSNVSVMAWKLKSSSDTVDDWWEIHSEELSTAFPDMSEVEIDTATLGGVAAKKYTYTVSLNGEEGTEDNAGGAGSSAVEYKYMQIAAVKSGSVFVLTYTAEPDNFDGNLDDVMSIARELRYRPGL